MATRSAAESAIQKMDQTQLDGRTIRVNEGRPKGQGPERGFGPGGKAGFNVAGKEEVKLYVGNLSFDTDQDGVQKFFEQYGVVTDCFLPTDRDSGKLRGFAFVTMKADDAQKACENANGAELDGRNLKVNEAQPKGARGGGGGYGDGGGYGGGGGGWGGGSVQQAIEDKPFPFIPGLYFEVDLSAGTSCPALLDAMFLVNCSLARVDFGTSLELC